MIRWTYAFIDRPTAAAGRARAFWTEVTGTHASVPWGDRGEFTTLLPDEAEGADACMAVQAVGGASGAHPDLAVEDRPAFTARATGLGAVVEARRPELTVLRSPGGQRFCLVPWRGQKVRPPVLAARGGPEPAGPALSRCRTGRVRLGGRLLGGDYGMGVNSR